MLYRHSAQMAKTVILEEVRETDVYALQVLRALLHNEICLVPDNWRDDMDRFKKYVLHSSITPN